MNPSTSSFAGTARIAVAGLAGALLAGCAHTGDTLGYYWQSVRGHLQIMRAAEPVDEWIARPGTAAPLRARLELAQQARAFAVSELHLPDNASYRRYADLGRRAAVWNVVAAPPDSLTLHTWCFPVTGCIGYRGYFAEADAQAEAARLAADGLETAVYGVPAYSTLGYTNWMGGDPLLNTFIGWPEGEFVRLLFHELAHQVVYANGDTMFNESFATAVERLGVARWLVERATPQAREEYARDDARRTAFRELTRAARERLAALYAREAGSPALPAEKQQAMERFRADYAALRAQWRVAPTGEPGTALIEQVLSPDAASRLDRFDRVQLEDVLAVCRTSASLSAAGRALFDRSRERKQSVNDADRLRKYLARFGLDWQTVKSAW